MSENDNNKLNNDMSNSSAPNKGVPPKVPPKAPVPPPPPKAPTPPPKVPPKAPLTSGGVRVPPINPAGRNVPPPPPKADSGNAPKSSGIPGMPPKPSGFNKADAINKAPSKPLKSDTGEKLSDDENNKKQKEAGANISKQELKEAKREEKARLRREKQRIKDEQRNRKLLNDDTRKKFGEGQSLKGGGNKKSANGDINQKKKGKKKWLLLLLLLLLIIILVVFLVWGDDILNPDGEFHITPKGNVVQIKPNVDGWAIEDCRFLAGDTIYFVENLYLILPRINENGKYNNMCTFRFRVLLETDDTVYSDAIDYINEKGSTSIKYFRGYWYYYGILLPDNQMKEIISSLTFKRTLGNDIAGKVCTLKFELETVYPSGEEIDNTFGACPGDWRFGIEEYYYELLSEGWR